MSFREVSRVCSPGSTTISVFGTWSRMFMSVWYAKKMGCRFLNNVRKAKNHRHLKMVGMFTICYLIFYHNHPTIYLRNLYEDVIVLVFSDARLVFMSLIMLLLLGACNIFILKHFGCISGMSKRGPIQVKFIIFYYYCTNLFCFEVPALIQSSSQGYCYT